MAETEKGVPLRINGAVGATAGGAGVGGSGLESENKKLELLLPPSFLLIPFIIIRRISSAVFFSIAVRKVMF